MVLVDYSKELGYSIHEECEHCGSMMTLEDSIDDFKDAFARALDFADDDILISEYFEKPVVSFSAVSAFLRDSAS